MACDVEAGFARVFSIIKTKTAVRLLLLFVFLSIGAPLWSGTSTCDSDHLPHPPVTNTRGTALQSTGVAAASDIGWREIQTVVVLPSEFQRDPLSNLPNGMTKAELIADAKTSIAMANAHLRPLRVVLRAIEFQIFDDPDEDPFEPAVQRRNPYDMLQTAISRSNSYRSTDYDLVLLLGRRYFNGKYGLAYPGVSCISKQYSVVFATQAGGGPRLQYGLAHTIAHEVGHYLGMSHDSQSYAEGISLMAPRFAVHPFGFSETSLAQARGRIAAGAEGGSCFRSLPDYEMPDDQDWDGVSDSIEASIGSDQNDPGSGHPKLQSPVYAVWNSFLNTTNILELVNTGENTLEVEVVLYSRDGTTFHSQFLSIDPFDQYDLILNELPGFLSDSYGLVALVFDGELDGRMSYYRHSASHFWYEYAFSIPLLAPRYGRSLVSFNTNQPSQAAEERAHRVTNWLTIVNLLPKEQLYRISSFDFRGNVLRSVAIVVPGLGRVDVDGGHGFAGSSAIGTHLIQPMDPSAPYIAKNIRYAGNSVGPLLPSAYHFASPTLARAGNGRPVLLPISATSNEDNWLEIGNGLSQTVHAELLLLDQDGNLLKDFQLTFGPWAQQHIDAAAILRSHRVVEGTAILIPSVTNSIIADSVVYVRSAKNGSVTASYGIASREVLHEEAFGSFNLFLEAENILRLTNARSTPGQAVVTLSSRGSIRSIALTLPANSTRTISIGDIPALAAASNSYGLFHVAGSGISSGLIRKRSVAGRIDLAMPTELR